MLHDFGTLFCTLILMVVVSAWIVTVSWDMDFMPLTFPDLMIDLVAGRQPGLWLEAMDLP
jgi:hypothetical protein